MRDLVIIIGSIVIGYLAAVVPIHWRLDRLDTEVERMTSTEHKRTVELARALEDRLAALEESKDSHGERIGDLDYRLSDLLKRVAELCRRLDLMAPLGKPGSAGAAPEPQPAPKLPGESQPQTWLHKPIGGPVLVQEWRLTREQWEAEAARRRLPVYQRWP